jgi:hypothetical protein
MWFLDGLPVTLLAASLAAAPGPVAAFMATSPVGVGQPVAYVDQSFDPAPGHVIVQRLWIGRQASFAAPGDYPVELLVEDDRGLWGSVVHVVHVVGSGAGSGGGSLPPPPPPPPPPQPPPPAPSPSVVVSPATLARGETATVTVTAATPILSAALELPGAFTSILTLPYETVDYGRLNAAQPAIAGDEARLTLYVPWSRSTPADGVWTGAVAVTTTTGTYRCPFQVTVAGTLQWQDTTPASAP